MTEILERRQARIHLGHDGHRRRRRNGGGPARGGRRILAQAPGLLGVLIDAGGSVAVIGVFHDRMQQLHGRTANLALRGEGPASRTAATAVNGLRMERSLSLWFIAVETT